MAKKRPTREEIRRNLTREGDLMGLMRFLAENGGGFFAGSQLTRCVQSQHDVDRLIDDGFGLILQVSVTLLDRSQYLILNAIDHHDGNGRNLRSLPDSLKPTLAQFENYARFLSEMAQARQRVRHLKRLDAQRESKKNTSRGPKSLKAYRGIGRNLRDGYHEEDNANQERFNQEP